MTGTIEQIYRQHRRGLFTLALSITRNPQSAEDAVHDAVVRLCGNRKPLTGDAVPYVFAAVRNAAVDQLRRGGPRLASDVSIFDIATVTAGPGIDDMAQGAERNEMIAQALDTLVPEQREAVVLHLYAGLSLQQAADAAGTPLQTMASRYRRALLSLRNLLGSLK